MMHGKTPHRTRFKVMCDAALNVYGITNTYRYVLTENERVGSFNSPVNLIVGVSDHPIYLYDFLVYGYSAFHVERSAMKNEKVA
jgi:hypothetical protein